MLGTILPTRDGLAKSEKIGVKNMKMKQNDFLENVVRIFTPRKDETGTAYSYFTNTLPDGSFDRLGIHFQTIDEAKAFWRKFAK